MQSTTSNDTINNSNGKSEDTMEQSKPSASTRKPAPDLLFSDTSSSSLTLSLSLNDNTRRSTNTKKKNSNESKQEEDPLGHPAASPAGPKPTHNNANAKPTKVEMTQEQFWAGINRFAQDDDDDDNNNHVTPNLGPIPPPRPSTTESAPTPIHTASPTSIIAGAVACLCSATLGAGILSLPYAMAEAGMLCGMALLVASALATSYSIQLLVQAMQVVYYNHNNHNDTTRSSNNQEKNYEDLVEVCLGKPYRRLAEASMLIFCCGGAVAYVIAVGDILQQSGWAHRSASSRALAMTLAWAVAMVPLSLLRTMKSLECTSSIGIASITTLVLAALYHYLEHPGEQPSTDEWLDKGDEKEHQSILEPTQGALSILRACPIILFAFSCQVNVCAIYDEMPGALETQQQQQSIEEDNVDEPNLDAEAQMTTNDNTAQEQSSNSTLACSKFQRMNTVTWCAVGICALLYSSISVIALLDFGSTNMTPNILSSYNPESVMQVAFIGMTIAVVLAYPMNIFPARVTLLGIVRTLQSTEEQPEIEDGNELIEPLMPGDSATNTATPLEITQAESGGTFFEHVLATMFLTGLSLGLAIVAPNISVVFGLLGGTSSSVLGFVIPGFLGYMTANDFYQVADAGNILGESAAMEANRRAAKRTRILSMLLVVAGIVVGIVTTGVTVYSTFAS